MGSNIYKFYKNVAEATDVSSHFHEFVFMEKERKTICPENVLDLL